MSDPSDLAGIAYAECGSAYRTAVDVTLFTWKAFYTRSAAVLTVAGYIVFNEQEFAWLATLLLLLAALATWGLTRRQLLANQNVIRKVMAAGLFLETKHESLGCRFKLDAFGDQLEEGKQLKDLWPGPPEPALVPLRGLGLTPRLEALCGIYALVYLGFAVIAFVIWLMYQPPCL